MLGIDQFIVYKDVEDPILAPDELCFDVELLLDCGRQTGGSGQVVSNDAVMNDDIHSSSSFWLSFPLEPYTCCHNPRVPER